LFTAAGEYRKSFASTQQWCQKSMLSRLSLRAKLLALLGLSALAFVASIGLGASILHQRLIDDRVDKLRAVVQSAQGYARDLNAQVVAKTMTREQATDQLRVVLRRLVFDHGEGYISVVGNDGIVHIQPSAPDKENAPSTAMDAGGRPLVDIYNEALRGREDGVIRYMYPRPGQSQPLPKIGYVARFDPWQVVFLSGAYTDDLAAEFDRILIHWSLMGAIIFALIVPVVLLINRDITHTLAGLRNAMVRLSDGDLTVEVPGSARRDEIGSMARAVAVFKESANRVMSLQEEQTAERERSAHERRGALLGLADQFDQHVRGVVDSVSLAGNEMNGAAQQVSGSAQSVSNQAAAALTEAEQATANVQSVAAAIEEMVATSSEITRQVTRAATISREAADEGRRTNDTVAGLATAAQKVGDVVSLIQNIAAQTNLLALNATIEAARAGDAGKGFAVVAGEVKSLANQTARATEDIRQQIASIQSESNAALAAIGAISRTVHGVEEIAAGIASTVEQQSAAIQEISGNIQQAADRTRQVAEDLRLVSDSVGKNGAAATAVLTAAELLDQQASVLRSEVEGFLGSVRAA
jgi:methyl-accepting chemotaxis protein